MRQTYLDLLEKHRKEINEFPIAYAFNEQQLKEALEKLGVLPIHRKTYAPVTRKLQMKLEFDEN